MFKQKIRSIVFVIALIVAMGNLWSYPITPPARAAGPYTVNNNGDGADSNIGDGVCDNGSGQCTLRAAIDQANADGGSTINFSGPMTIILGSSLAITSNITIDGGANDIAVTGGGFDIFTVNVTSGNSLSISNLTLTGGTHGVLVTGNNSATGAVINVTGVTFNGNSNTGGAAKGAGIYNDDFSFATVNVNNSLFSNNSSTNGGAIYNFSGILNVTNSTFFGNSATISGAAITNSNPGQTHIKNSTFSGNTGAATLTLNGADATNPPRSMNNSILNSTVAGCPEVTASGNNWISVNGATCASGTNAGTINLAALADNGGPVQTMALQAGSAALDAGDIGTCAATDARGIARPQGTTCDMGAYELEVAPVPVPVPVPTALIPPTMTSIGDQTMNANNTLNFSFRMNDDGYNNWINFTQWKQSATSSNQTLLPNGNISLTAVPSDYSHRVGGMRVDMEITPTLYKDGETTITVKVCDSANVCTQEAFKLTVNPGSRLQVSPTTLSFTGDAGSTEPLTDLLTVTNIWTATMDWQVTESPSWLTASPTSGTGDGQINLTVSPPDTVGNYTGTVVIDSNGGAYPGGVISVTTALEVVNRPLFTSSPVTSGVENQPYSYNITVQDADENDPLTIEATEKPAWLSLGKVSFSFNNSGSQLTAQMSGTPLPADVGNNTVSLLTTDLKGLTDTQTFVINVTGTGVVTTPTDPTTTVPIFISTPIERASLNSSYAYVAQATDPDMGDSLTINAEAIPSWLSITDYGTGVALLKGDPAAEGVYPISLKVTDSAGQSSTQSFSLTVVAFNTEPVINSTPPNTAMENTPYTYSVTTVDPDLNETLSIKANLKPAWLTLVDNGDGTATLSGTPALAQIGKKYTIILQVTDGLQESSSQQFELTVVNVQDAPIFTSSPILAGTQDVAYQYDVTATDADTPLGDTMTISADSKPAWLTLTDNGNGTAKLIGTPANADVGNQTVSLKVTDGTGLNEVQSFTISVENVNDAPTFTSQPITQATEDSEYQYTIEITDPDVGDSPYVWATRPNWLSLSLINGKQTLIGTPDNDAVGTHKIVVYAVDQGQVKIEQAYTLNVANTNDPPTITSLPANKAYQNKLYQYEVQVEDIDPADTLTVSIVDGPAWLTVGATNRFVSAKSLVQGTPGIADVGVHNVKLQVADSGGLTAEQVFTLTVENLAPDAVPDDITTNFNTAATIQPLSNDSDPDGNTLSLASVTQASNGTVTQNGNDVVYTPNTGFDGSDVFTYTVSDGLASTSAVVNMKVWPDNRPPTAVADSGETVTSLPTTLDLIANDTDPDNNSLKLVSLGKPNQGGTVVMLSGGKQVTYRSASNFIGTETFTYTMEEDIAVPYPATVGQVTITVKDPASIQADLEVKRTAGINELQANEAQAVKSSFELKNLSNEAAIGVLFKHGFGLKPLSMQAKIDSGSQGVCKNADNGFECRFDLIPAGSTVSISADSSLKSDQLNLAFAEVAKATSRSTDPNSGNNEAVANITVLPGAARSHYTLTGSSFISGVLLSADQEEVLPNGNKKLTGNITLGSFFEWAGDAARQSSAWIEIDSTPNVVDGSGTLRFKSSGVEIYRGGWSGLSGRRNVLAVGDGGSIFRYNGSGWDNVASGTTQHINAIWGSSANDIFAVGNGGTILHFDGGSWTAMNSGINVNLSGVWGRGPNDVYAVGDQGYLLHYDGTKWSEFKRFQPTVQDAKSVWGTDDGHLFVAGTGLYGWVEHYNGSTWKLYDRIVVKATSSTSTIYDLWGTSSTDVYAAGDLALYRFDGTSWKTFKREEPYGLRSVWGTSSNNIYVSGPGAIYKSELPSWPRPLYVPSNIVKSLYGGSEKDIFAVGTNDKAWYYNGTSWRTINQGVTGDLRDVWVGEDTGSGEVLLANVAGFKTSKPNLSEINFAQGFIRGTTDLDIKTGDVTSLISINYLMHHDGQASADNVNPFTLNYGNNYYMHYSSGGIRKLLSDSRGQYIWSDNGLVNTRWRPGHPIADVDMKIYADGLVSGYGNNLIKGIPAFVGSELGNSAMLSLAGGVKLDNKGMYSKHGSRLDTGANSVVLWLGYFYGFHPTAGLGSGRTSFHPSIPQLNPPVGVKGLAWENHPFGIGGQIYTMAPQSTGYYTIKKLTTALDTVTLNLPQNSQTLSNFNKADGVPYNTDLALQVGNSVLVLQKPYLNGDNLIGRGGTWTLKNDGFSTTAACNFTTPITINQTTKTIAPPCQPTGLWLYRNDTNDKSYQQFSLTNVGIDRAGDKYTLNYQGTMADARVELDAADKDKATIALKDVPVGTELEYKGTISNVAMYLGPYPAKATTTTFENGTLQIPQLDIDGTMVSNVSLDNGGKMNTNGQQLALPNIAIGGLLWPDGSRVGGVQLINLKGTPQFENYNRDNQGLYSFLATGNLKIAGVGSSSCNPDATFTWKSRDVSGLKFQSITGNCEFTILDKVAMLDTISSGTVSQTTPTEAKVGLNGKLVIGKGVDNLASLFESNAQIQFETPYQTDSWKLSSTLTNTALTNTAKLLGTLNGKSETIVGNNKGVTVTFKTDTATPLNILDNSLSLANLTLRSWQDANGLKFEGNGSVQVNLNITQIDPAMKNTTNQKVSAPATVEIGKFRRPDGTMAWGMKGRMKFSFDRYEMAPTQISKFVNYPIQESYCVHFLPWPFNWMCGYVSTRTVYKWGYQWVTVSRNTNLGTYNYDKPFFIDSDMNLTIGGDTDQYQAQRSSRAKTSQTVNIPSPTRAEFWLRSRGVAPVTFTLSSPSGASHTANSVPTGVTYHEFVNYVRTTADDKAGLTVALADLTVQDTVSLAVDGQVVSDTLQASSNMSLTAGDHAIKVTSGGSTLLEQTVSLSAGQDYSLYLYNDGGSMKGMLETNDTLPGLDNGLIRVLNLRSGNPSIDVALSRADGSEIPLVNGLAYKQASDVIETIASTGYYTPDLTTLADQELLTVTVKEAGTSNVITSSFIILSPGSQVALTLLDYQGQAFVTDAIDRAMKRQTTIGYVIDTAETGTWTLHLDQETTDYELDIQVTKPKPQFSNVKLTGQTLAWQLTSGSPNTTVDLYYQTAPTTGDSYVGRTFTGSIPSAVDGSAQSYVVDTSLIPSGTYYVYLAADDGINEAIKVGAAEPLVIQHTWPDSWTANLNLTQTDYRQVTVKWDRFPNPDFDDYLLMWRTKGTTQTGSLPLDGTTFNRELIVNNLNAGQTYEMWLVGRDFQTQQSSRSETVEVLVKGAEFELIAPAEMPTIEVGKPVTISIMVKSNFSPYPEPIKLSEALDIPAGLNITFIPETVTPTPEGVAVQVVIEAGNLLPNGLLETLIKGFGGGTEFSLPFNPTIIAPAFTIGAPTDPIMITNLKPGSLTLTPNRQNGHDRIINLSVISAPQLSVTLSDEALADGETATVTLADFGADEPGSYNLILRLDDGVHTVDISRTITIKRPSFNLYPTSLEVLTETLHLLTEPGFDNIFRVPLAITVDEWDQPINLILDDSSPIPYGRFGLVAQSGARSGLSFQHIFGTQIDTLPDSQLADWLTFNQAGEAELYIEVTSDTPAGDYLIPMLAESDGEQVAVDVLLEVSNAIPATDPPENINTVYLPIMLK